MKKYIVSDPKILGGKPVIVGTRIPVAQILHLLKEGYTVEAIAEEYALDSKIIKRTIDETAKFLNSNASQIL